MAEKPPKVILDTNILISALIYGGKPEQIYNLVLEKRITAAISSILLVELTETLIKKFRFDLIRIVQLEKIIRKHFKIVHPNKTINIVGDEDDNRVLEAAIEGKCSYIVTGDQELLDLGSFKGMSKALSDEIKLLTADQFLSILEESEMLSK